MPGSWFRVLVKICLFCVVDENSTSVRQFFLVAEKFEILLPVRQATYNSGFKEYSIMREAVFYESHERNPPPIPKKPDSPLC